MIVLVSGATATMRRLDDDRFGTLIVPSARNRPSSLPLEKPWALDNAAYVHFDACAYERMLDRFHGQHGCRFVVCPDVVGDSRCTLRLFNEWESRVRRYGFPLAFVAQDGLTVRDAPWQRFEALFIGGTTVFKWSSEARTLCAYARALGKWVHIGRVNSWRGLRKAKRRGAHSVDGTHISRYPDIGAARFQRWLTQMRAEPELVW